jgi:hypothetical protein
LEYPRRSDPAGFSVGRPISDKGHKLVLMISNRRTTRWLLTATSLIALIAAAPGLALAQDVPQPAAPPPAATDPAKSEPQEHRDQIIVIGNRAIITSLKDVVIEDTYDADAIASYGVGTVGEAIDEVRRENGDEDPAILVNGRPVANPDDIANLPVEAVARVEVLPRGSATQIGGQPGQRAYNVVLRASVKSVTLSASREEATEGGWSNSRGEALLTYIKGQDRISLTIRGAQSTALRESERDFVPRTETTPYSPIGNLLPATGAEVDPAFSALFGQSAGIIGLPAGLTNPTLAALLPFGNVTNPSGQSAYRTLRGPARPIDLALTGNKTLNPWLSLSFNSRFSWSKTENISGLPSARFTIPQTHPSTPFSVPVVLALNDPARPLLSQAEANTQALSATLNAQLGPWRASLTGKWDRRESHYLSQFTGPLGTAATVDPAINPFSGGLAATIPVSERLSSSRFSNSQVLLEFQGPIFALWAGPLSARGGVGASWIDYQAEDPSGPRQFERREYSAKTGLTIPLTSKQFGFLPGLGESEIDLDYGASDLGAFGRLERRSIAFNWQPATWLRIVATDQRDERAVGPELLAAPVVTTPNVPYFDPLTGQTVEVTTIYGGAANLEDEVYRTQSIAFTISPSKRHGLQLNAEYAINDLRNQVGALPLPSSAVVAAFPDRFVRDGAGTLVLVDNRSVNFARQRSEVLRLGLRFALPLSKPGQIQPREASGGRRRVPAWRLAFSVNHTILLDSRATIRTGLPEVDLLSGGAIGIGGGQQRHSTRANLALTRGGTGVRLDYARRGASNLATGTLALPDLLDFAPLSTFDLKAFADLTELLPKAGLPRGTRLTLTVDNLANQRQLVTNSTGITPQAYQPVRRDPIGRTVMLELRIVF